MARVASFFVLINLCLFLAVGLAAPAEKQLEQSPAEARKEDLVAATDDLKPAASHWGGFGHLGYGGYGGYGYGGYGYGGYPYYGSHWGYPSYSYGYWPYGGYYGHHGGYWW